MVCADGITDFNESFCIRLSLQHRISLFPGIYLGAKNCKNSIIHMISLANAVFE